LGLNELAVVRHEYNTIRLHAGVGYVTPEDEHEGRGEQIRRGRRAGMHRTRARRITYHREQRDQANRRRPNDAG
jgi:putative transposase